MDSPNSPGVDLEKGFSNQCHSRTDSGASSKPILRNEAGASSSKQHTWRPWSRTKGSGREPEIRKLDGMEQSYRSLATFMDSDENFMCYRRFGYLHARTLLRKQDRLRKLEEELEKYDNYDATTPEGIRLLMSRDIDEAADRKEPANIRTRTQILDDIEMTLEKYDLDEWVFKAQQMVAFNKPAERDYRSVEAYIHEKKPVLDEEYGFIYQKDDLVTLRDGRESAFLDSFTERMLQMFHSKALQRIFTTKADREKTDDPYLHYYSKSRKDVFITSVLCLVLLCLLILPVFVLYKLTIAHSIEVTYTVSIGVLLVFTLIFSAVLSLFTKAKRHEIFGAAAGYCAVLVVFISNIPGANAVMTA